MSDPMIEGAINRQTAATLALAEAQYRTAEEGYEPSRHPDQIVRDDFEKWLHAVLDDDFELP